METAARTVLRPEDFEKKAPIEHILDAPDSYVGSTVVATVPVWKFSGKSGDRSMRFGDVTSCEAIDRLFLEILSNAADNIINTRLFSATTIDARKTFASVRTPPVSVSVTDVSVTIRNSGHPIPVAPHPQSTTETNLVLVPELIFGELLTSSNYNKKVARVSAGRNGYGAKLANIFSTRFSVKIGDPVHGQEYEGVWINNMSSREKSVSKPGYAFDKASKTWKTAGESDAKRGKAKIYTGPAYVEVSYDIDFSRFAPLKSYSLEIVDVFARHALDYTFTAKIPIRFNDEIFDARAPRTFAKYYFPKESGEAEDDSSPADRAVVWYEWASKRDADDAAKLGSAKDAIVKSINSGVFGAIPMVELIVLDTPDEPVMLSYVNGLLVPEGVHVAEALKKVATAIIAASPAATAANKGGVVTLTANDVKSHISLIVNCHLENPIFASQTKQRLAEPTPRITITADAFKSAMTSASASARWSVGARLAEASAVKTQRAIAKTDAGKKRKRVAIDAGEDANWAGGERSKECVLYLCEGESAAGMIKQRINLLGGKNVNGYFPTKGKSLNVSAASDAAALANKEFGAIKQLIGLAEGADYSNAATAASMLRYGRVIIAADQDVDGFHVRALLLNMFASKWPSLIKEGRIAYLATPLVRVTEARTGKCVHRFFSESSFDSWLHDQPGRTLPRGLKVAYYKGLASSSTTDIKEDLEFSPLIVLVYDSSAKESLSLGFNPKRADDRKKWITDWIGVGITGEDFEMQAVDEAIRDAKACAAKKNIAPKLVPTGLRDVTSMLNTDLVNYSAETLFRSIPSMFDGLKRSQRQAIYHALEYWNYRSPHLTGGDGIKDPVKIARLAAAAAERVLYQHGEASLVATYIGLTQNFCGANNIAVLDRVGQLGCLAPETPILMYSGGFKCAESVRKGDTLVGDDGTIRNVLETTSGIDMMYAISQIDGTRRYIVNSIHILTLCDPRGNIIDIALPDFLRLPESEQREHSGIVFNPATKATSFYKFKVEFVRRGKYVGWNLDGNERFLLGDFTVTHNTRHAGGKDAGAGRYVSTRLDWLAPLIFSRESVALSPQRDVEGEKVEPGWLPADLPLGVINETLGIGTGFQSKIPGHHPVETADWLLARIRGKTRVAPPSPWYAGFTGRIYIADATAAAKPKGGKAAVVQPKLFDDDDDDDTNDSVVGRRKVVTEGIFRVTRQPSATDGTTDVLISELPVGVWTGPYRKWLEALITVGALGDLVDTSTTDTVSFELKKLDTSKLIDVATLKAANTIVSGKKASATDAKTVAKSVAKAAAKPSSPPPVTLEMLKLRKNISLNTMTMIDMTGLPRVFRDVEEILEVYTVKMLEHYETVKVARIRSMNAELSELSAKHALIFAIVTKKLVVFGVDESVVVENIAKQKLSVEAFHALKIRECTAEKVEALAKKIEEVKASIAETQATPSWRFWERRIVAARAEIVKRMKV
jgi:DNA gyrase/topoisomerase IV subunit B